MGFVSKHHAEAVRLAVVPSRVLGQPEVRAVLEEEGTEPAVILTFTWGVVTW